MQFLSNVGKKAASLGVLQTYIKRYLMMEAVCTSETWVNFNMTTQHYIPEDSKLHTSRCENLKSQKVYIELSLYSTTSFYGMMQGQHDSFSCYPPIFELATVEEFPPQNPS
jgi:hypothetical protein